MPGSPLSTESTQETLEIGREAEGLQRLPEHGADSVVGAFGDTDSLPLGGRTVDLLT